MSRHHTAYAIAALVLAAIAGQANAGPAVTFVDKQQVGEWLTHRLHGTKVLNAQAEEIGEIKDVVIDAKGAVSTVVLGVGGFLGVPEKLVAVPFSAIQIGDVVQSSRVVVLDVSKDALKAAPAYVATDPAMADRVKQKASDWMAAAKAKVTELMKVASEKAKAAADKAKEMSTKKDEVPAAPAPAPTKP